MNFITEPVYLVQGKQHITSLWRASSKSRGLALYKSLFEHWFAVSPGHLSKWVHDDSGHNKKPHPMSSVPPQSRFDHFSHTVFKDMLSGPDLPLMCTRFALRLCEGLAKLDLPRNSTSLQLPDLETFFEKVLAKANTESLWGTDFIEDSTFLEDYSGFAHRLHYFTCRLPRWLVSKAYAQRDRALAALKQWQSRSASGKVAPWNEGEYDAMRWGSKPMRHWGEEFMRMDGATPEDLASTHLTVAWA